MRFISPAAWLDFIGDTANALYIPLLVFAIGGCVILWRRRHGWRWAWSPDLYLLAVLVLDFGIRWFMYFVGYGFNPRYFMLEMLASCYPAAVAAIALRDWLQVRLAGRGWAQARRLATVGVVVIICAATLPRLLRVDRHVVWIVHMAEILKTESAATGRPAVLWMEHPDSRLAWLADATMPHAVNTLTTEHYFKMRLEAGETGDIWLFTHKSQDTVRDHFSEAGIDATVELIHSEPYKSKVYYMYRVHPAADSAATPETVER